MNCFNRSDIARVPPSRVIVSPPKLPSPVPRPPDPDAETAAAETPAQAEPVTSITRSTSSESAAPPQRIALIEPLRPSQTPVQGRVTLASLSTDGTQVLPPAIAATRPASTPAIARQTENVDISCFPESLTSVLETISRHFGDKPLIVTSGFRSANDNADAGGARKSYHVRCLAADIQIDGVAPADIAHYARTLDEVGGVGRYGHTRSIHVDVGERKFSWFGLHRHRHRHA